MKILIIRLSAIGDTVHSLPVASAIKQAIDGATVAWLVEPTSLPLVSNNPAVDRVFLLPRKKWIRNLLFPWMWPVVLFQVLAFIRLLQQERFDIAIDLQGLLKSAIWCFLSSARLRFGFANTREGAQWFLNRRFNAGNYFCPDTHIVDLNLQLVDYVLNNLERGGLQLKCKPQVTFPLPVTEGKTVMKLQELLGPESFGQEMLNADKDMVPQVVLITGTTWDTKIWDKKKWYQLARLLGTKLNCRIVLIGSKNELTINEKITGWLKNDCPEIPIVNLTSKTSLLDLKALFEMSYLVVGGDSGPLHLAAAVNKPYVVGIYGSTPWVRNGPYGKLCRAVKKELWCQPCFEKECPLGTIACLQELTAQEVFEQISLHLDDMHQTVLST